MFSYINSLRYNFHYTMNLKTDDLQYDYSANSEFNANP